MDQSLDQLLSNADAALASKAPAGQEEEYQKRLDAYLKNPEGGFTFPETSSPAPATSSTPSTAPVAAAPQVQPSATPAPSPAGPVLTAEPVANSDHPALQPVVDPHNEQSQLDELDALAGQRLKEKGVSNYVPPNWQETEEGRTGFVNAMQDIGAGFNYELAKALSIPVEVVERGMALLGTDYMQHGSPHQQTVAALNRMGIPTYQVDNLASKLGSDALPALATWGAIQYASPYMAQNQGTGVISYLARDIGEWALKHPISGAWLGLTSSGGGTIARDKFGDNPLVGLAGEAAGGATGSGILRASGAATRLGAKIVGKGINFSADLLPASMKNAITKWNPFYQVPVIPKEGIINPGANLATVQNYSEDQVAGLKMDMDNAVQRAIESIPDRGPPGVLQQVAHMNLQEAERISNGLVNRAWDRVDQTIRIPVSEMFRDLRVFRDTLRDTPSVRPNRLIQEGLRLSTNLVTRDPTTGRLTTVRAMPSVRRLRDYISSIRTEIIKEQASDAPRDGYIRNLNQLRDIVEENITNQFPQNTALAQARAASRMHHDMFSRGPISQVLSKKYNGDFRTDPSQSMTRLTNTPGGVQALREMTNNLSTPNYYGRGIAPAADEKRLLKQLETDFDNVIRSEFREAASESPQAAIKYNASVQPAIRGMTHVAAEMQLAVNKMQTALSIQKDIQNSALARFSETTPEKAVARIFADRDPAALARQLIRTFKGDPDALDGLRNQLVSELLFKRAQRDPLVMRDLLNRQSIRNMFEVVLSPDQLRRLNKVVDDTIRLTSGEDKGFARTQAMKFSVLGRIAGAWVGRQLPGTTLQGQGILSRVGARTFEKIFRTIPPEDMMVQAIIDPHFEHLLYSRLPVSTKEAKAAALSYRRLYSVLDTVRQERTKPEVPISR